MKPKKLNQKVFRKTQRKEGKTQIWMTLMKDNWSFYWIILKLI